MSKSPSYLVIFNSRGSNVLDASSRSRVNWEAFLDKNKKKFKCQFSFKSEATAGALVDVGWVGMNLGKMDIYDGNAQSNNLGTIYPVVIGANSYYSSTVSDDLDFVINYPSQRQVTVTLNRFDNTTPIASMPHYCLFLSLTEIPDN